MSTGGQAGVLITENTALIILAEDILTRVNQITNRGLSSIDTELSEVLIEISRRTLCLKETDTDNTVAAQNYIDKPADMVNDEIFGLVVDEVVYKPISWPDFLNGVGYGYCVFGDKIYFTPTHSDAKAYTLYYPRVHPVEVTTIYIPGVYKEAVIHLTCAKIYHQYNLYDDEKVELDLYEREISNLSGHSRTPPVCKPYKGLF